MKNVKSYLLTVIFLSLISGQSNAESLRCNGDIVEIGDTKAEVIEKCGNPEMTDSYCEKSVQKIKLQGGSTTIVENCENVDIWTYNPGTGQFLTNLYFAQGQLREMRYGDRVK